MPPLKETSSILMIKSKISPCAPQAMAMEVPVIYLKGWFPVSAMEGTVDEAGTVGLEPIPLHHIPHAVCCLNFLTGHGNHRPAAL